MGGGGWRWGRGVPCTKGPKAGGLPALDLGSPPPFPPLQPGKGAGSEPGACLLDCGWGGGPRCGAGAVEGKGHIKEKNEI